MTGNRKYVEVAVQMGGAIGHISSARERLSSRQGYTFTQKEIDYLVEQLDKSLVYLETGTNLLADLAPGREVSV